MSEGGSTLPKICVIVGAGASYDVWNGVGPEDAEFRPPLTSQLFEPRFWNILRGYSGAAVLAQELGPLAEVGALNLEQKLYEYFTGPELIHEHFKQIPMYLRDLLASVSLRNSQAPGCYTQLVKRLLIDNPHEVLYLILNYDDLLERALGALDPRLALDASQPFRVYVDRSRQAKVVKLHGSVDSFVPIGNDPTKDWLTTLAEFSFPIDPMAMFRRPGVSSTRDRQEQGYLYPVVTAPLAEKGPGSFVCPDQHLDVARAFLRGCSKFLIIGTSGLDSHLLNLLGETITPGGSPEPFLVNAQIVGDEKVYEAARRFNGLDEFAMLGEPGTVYTNGFRKYLMSDEFDRFVSGG